MDINNIHVRATGFLLNSEYSFYFQSLLTNYRDWFGNAESLTVNIEEERPGIQLHNRKEQCILSEHGNTVEVNISFSKFTDCKGREIILPEPYHVFQTLYFVMDKAVLKYHQRFGQEIERRFTDYNADTIDGIKNKTLIFGLGSNSMNDTEIREAIIGNITLVHFATNSPNLLTGVDITPVYGEIKKVNVYQIKKIFEL